MSSSSCHCGSIDGAGHHNLPHLLAQEQLAGNEPGFDGLAQADVIRDEEVDAWQHERFAQGFKLIGIQAMPARNGAWNKRGSVVTQFQRRVCRYAAKRAGRTPAEQSTPTPHPSEWPDRVPAPRALQVAGPDCRRRYKTTAPALLAGNGWRNDILNKVEPLPHTSNMAGRRDGQQARHASLYMRTYTWETHIDALAKMSYLDHHAHYNSRSP